MTVAAGADLEAAVAAVRRHGAGEPHVEPERRQVVVPVKAAAGVLAAVVRDLDAAGVGVEDLGLRRPTLDDVLLALTGRAAEESEGDGQTGEAGESDEKEIA